MERLNELLGQLAAIVSDLNNAIDQRTKASNEVEIAKAEVSKNTHKMKLIQEQIMCEKKLIDASR